MNNKVKYFIYTGVFIIAIIGLSVGYNFLNKKMEEDEIAKQNLTNQQSTTNYQNSEANTNQQNTVSQQKVPSRTATDFTVYTENGEEVLLSSFKGKPIVVNFWTTWCGYCKLEMPYFNTIYQKEKENVTFLMINETVQDEKQEAINYIKQEKYEFPVYYDTKGNAANAYKVTGYPVTIFINKNFEIQKIHQGAISQDRLQTYINQIK